MRSQFIQQIQVLMEVQQIKNFNTRNDYKNHYRWLCTEKFKFVYLSTQDECKLRQVLLKISADDQVVVMRQLMLWLDLNPYESPDKIPNVTIELINSLSNKNCMEERTFSRMASFRNSLRRFSLFSNRIQPEIQVRNKKARRSVTFNDIPVVYKISKSKF